MTPTAPLSEHLEALRRTLLASLAVVFSGFAIALIFYDPLFSLLTSPLETKELILLGPLDGLLTTLRVAFWSSLVLTAPAWGFLLFRFCAPGLHGQELRLILPFLLLSILLVGGGLVTGFTTSLPLATKLLWNFNSSLGQNLWTLTSYLSFALFFLLGQAAVFELVALLFFLVHFGVVSSATLAHHRRTAYVAILVIAAIATPPDIITQCLLAVPLIALYEGAILYGFVGTRIRS